MRKIPTLLSSLLLLSLSASASAFEADFMAKVKGVNTENPEARIISTAHFNDTNIQENGSFTIYYSVSNGFENLLFSGSATIAANETEVKVGKVKDGRITITQDLETGQIKTRFVQKVDQSSGANNELEYFNNNYYVTANTDITNGFWGGEATVSNAIYNDLIIVNPPQVELVH